MIAREGIRARMDLRFHEGASAKCLSASLFRGYLLHALLSYVL